jgi:hypothetical protein
MRKQKRQRQRKQDEPPNESESIASVNLKESCLNLLADNVLKGEDRGTRSVELLGKMKEHDWFVRNADEPRGIFAVLLDPSAGAQLDALMESLPSIEKTDES